MDVEERIRGSFESVRATTGVRTIRGVARRRRGVRRAAALMGIAAVVAATAVAAPSLVPLAEQPARASTLTRLAAVTRATPTVTVADGQYLYTRVLARRRNCDDGQCRWDRWVQEIWAATDGSGRMTGRSPIDGSWSELVGPGELGGSLNEGVPPSDVDELRAFIEERAAMAEQPLEWEMFVVVSDLLRETFSSPVLYSHPELRAALFEVAATLPGVEDLGATTDQIGRPGVAFGFTRGDERMELVFDPETATLLQEREVALSGSGDKLDHNQGSWGVFLEVGVTDSVRERP